MTFNIETNELNFYISYDYLSVKDYSKILNAINGVYESLTKMIVYKGIEYVEPFYIILYPIPICLEEVRTGNSIDFKISFNKKALPNLNIKKDKIHVDLPKWSAAFILTGMILSYGLDQWDKIESIRNNRLDSILTEMEIEQLKEDKSSVNELKMYYHEWNQVIQQDNINVVVINGEEIKSKNY